MPYIGWSQGITVVGLPHSDKQKNKSKSGARTQALVLPFWEDFSDTETSYANEDLWQYGRSILVNTGLPINPPSLRVATFDGIDSLGKPYSSTDILAKGYADKLVSNPIDLTAIPDENMGLGLS
ncbi:MAG: hypothetical protein WDO15_20740 [Bacteroidota bacterium]